MIVAGRALIQALVLVNIVLCVTLVHTVGILMYVPRTFRNGNALLAIYISQHIAIPALSNAEAHPRMFLAYVVHVTAVPGNTNGVIAINPVEQRITLKDALVAILQVTICSATLRDTLPMYVIFSSLWAHRHTFLTETHTGTAVHALVHVLRVGTFIVPWTVVHTIRLRLIEYVEVRCGTFLVAYELRAVIGRKPGVDGAFRPTLPHDVEQEPIWRRATMMVAYLRAVRSRRVRQAFGVAECRVLSVDDVTALYTFRVHGAADVNTAIVQYAIGERGAVALSANTPKGPLGALRRAVLSVRGHKAFARVDALKTVQHKGGALLRSALPIRKLERPLRACVHVAMFHRGATHDLVYEAFAGGRTHAGVPEPGLDSELIPATAFHAD